MRGRGCYSSENGTGLRSHGSGPRIEGIPAGRGSSRIVIFVPTEEDDIVDVEARGAELDNARICARQLTTPSC